MSWATEKPVIFYNEDEMQLKLQFARLLVEFPDEKHMAGYRLFPGEENYGHAMQAQAWLSDPFVQREVGRLLASGEVEPFLWSKDQYLKKIQDTIEGAVDPKTKLEGFKVYGQAAGFIEKSTNVNVDNSKTYNILRVPSRVANDEEQKDFEARFKAQQTQLIKDARSSRTH